jgi:hypothetical protein
VPELSDEAAVRALNERFAGFYDAVVVEFNLTLPRVAADRRATVRLIAADETGAWVSVILTISRVSEFKLIEGKSSNLVLSDGLRIHHLADEVFVDLAPYSETTDVNDLRRSHQYIVGGSCSVEVEEFRE